MGENVETLFGFIWVEKSNNNYFVDIYTPRRVLKSLRMVPGSPVAIKGLSKNSTGFYMRPYRKASEAIEENSFVAIVRLPNAPGILRDFLATAREAEFRFEMIRGLGSHDLSGSDLFCEGYIDIDGTNKSVFFREDDIRRKFEQVVSKINGAIEDLWCLQVGKGKRSGRRSKDDIIWGEMETPLFKTSLDRPSIFEEAYGLIRVNAQGISNPLSRLSGDSFPRIARLHVDHRRAMVFADLSYAASNYFYELSYTCRPEDPAHPIVMRILDTLSGGGAIRQKVNIEAVEAIEHVRDFVGTEGQERHLLASINIVFSMNEDLHQNDLDELRTKLQRKSEISVMGGGVIIASVNAMLSKRAGNHPIPSDTKCPFFRRILFDGRYIFISSLGKGGFGAVNRFLDTFDGQTVAIKHLTNSRDMKTLHGSTTQEMVTQSQLDHPNIAELKMQFKDGSYPVLVVEHCDNVLKNHVLYLKRQNKKNLQIPELHEIPSDLPEFLQMALQLSQGIAYLHSMGYVHGDISPDNIGFRYTYASNLGTLWKLIDFGATKKMEDQQPRKTLLAGKATYQSPETVAGRLTDKSDVYSLGVVLYQILSGGAQPYKNMGTGADGKTIRITRPLKLSSRFRPQDTQLTENLGILIFKALSLEESSRYSSSELVCEFEKLMREFNMDKLIIPPEDLRSFESTL